MRKTILITIGCTIGFCGILFWLFFLIIAFRNESLVADFKGDKLRDDVYIRYGDINYYLIDAKEVYVYDLRLIFKTNKRRLSDVIKDGEFLSLLNSLSKYEYYANMGFETKYYTSDKSFVITKCEYWLNDNSSVHYVIDDEYKAHICNKRFYEGMI